MAENVVPSPPSSSGPPSSAPGSATPETAASSSAPPPATPEKPAPKPGSKAWDDAAIERIRAAAEKRDAKPEAEAKAEPAKAEEKAPEAKKETTEELLRAVRAERARHEAETKARELEGKIKALEPEAGKTKAFVAAMDAGDIEAALTALGIPKARWFTGEKSLYWQLARLASQHPEAEAEESEEDKPLTKADIDRLWKEREEAARKEQEDAHRARLEKSQRALNEAGQLYVTALNETWDPAKYPTVAKVYKQGIPYDQVLAVTSNYHQTAGKPLEPSEFWQLCEDHWKRELGVGEPVKAAESPVATANGSALRTSPGAVPEARTWKTVAEFDRMAREKLEADMGRR